jgi:hypothetical protein
MSFIVTDQENIKSYLYSVLQARNAITKDQVPIVIVSTVALVIHQETFHGTINQQLIVQVAPSYGSYALYDC